MRRICYGLLLLALSACDADDPCDDGFTYKQGACMPDAPAMSGGSNASNGGGGSGSKGDASMSLSTAGDGEGGDSCSEDLDAILDATCMTDADCNCAAPYCAKMPGAPMGTCTVFCNPDPDDCPEGHRCFDLSALGVQGYEPFCIKAN